MELMTKKGSIGNSIEDRLVIDLSEIIERKHHELLTVTNSGLVTLFWQIGKVLNECIDKNKSIKYGNSVIDAISTQLITKYGSYFAKKNLKKLGQFAEQFPDFSSIKQFALLVSWEQILPLLQLEDLEAKLFYIRLTVEQGLSVKDLRKQISANSFYQTKTLKGSKDNSAVLTQSLNAEKFLYILQQSLIHTSRINPLIQNVFEEPLLPSFRQLLEPLEVTPALPIEKSTKILCSEEELFGVILQHIEKFRYQHISWLNTNLNLSLWEIGKRINQKVLLNNNDSTNQELIIHNVSTQLEKKYGKNFSKKQLYEMEKFAEKFTDKNIASYIAYLVRWNYILSLLPLQKIEAILFYTKLTATQGLSIDALQKQIDKNAYEQTSGAKEIEQSTIAALQNPTIKTSIEKKGNATIKATTVLIRDNNINSNLAVKNIFKNLHMPLLVLEPTKFLDKNMGRNKTQTLKKA